MSPRRYFVPHRRVRLKRPRRMRLVLPVILGSLVIVLGLMAIGRHARDSEPLPGHARQKQPAAATTAQSGGQDRSKEIAEKAPVQDGQPKAHEEHVQQPAQDPVQVVEKTVHPGETITSMLSDFLEPADVYALSRQARDVYPLRKIKAGQPYRLKIQDEQLKGFEYEIDNDRKLCVRLNNQGFQVATKEIQYDVQSVIVHGDIQSSLFQAVTESGESAELAVKLADIFAWDVDFIRDIRQGDSFRLVVEKRYRNDKFCTYGPIVAAQFTNHGQTYQAFLFTTRDGRHEYFNASGQAVRKTFLKAPLHFTRISSGYSRHRMHPILHVVRPHLGIDYAAPTGTPIKSVADGVVIARAYGKGGGNYLKIRHPNGYVTIYNHMSRYAGGIHRGTNVTQGQVIGYVGSTGLATGPHLDFRVKKHGSYMNPLKIDSKPVRPIPKQEMARFQRAIQPLQAALEGKNPLYAQAETSQTEAQHAKF